MTVSINPTLHDQENNKNPQPRKDMSASEKSLLQRLPGVFVPVLVMAFSASLAKFVWMVFEPPQEVSAAPVNPTVITQMPRPAANLGKVIADNHIFGEVKRTPTPVRRTAPTPVPKPAAPAKPAVPPLQLYLHGLWAKKRSDGRTEESFKALPISQSEDIVSKIATDLDELFDSVGGDEKPVTPAAKAAAGFAIMSHSGGDQQMYKEGESIAEDVKVLEIFVDKVVVENRGIRQEIFLSDGKSVTTTAAVGTTAIPAPVRTLPRPNTRQAVSANIAAGQQNGTPAGMSDPRQGGQNLGQRDLLKLREDVINDASILAQYSAPEPLVLDGTVKGFRLHLSNRLRLLYQVGFRPGDVVTELNGVRLNDPATVNQALYDFISSDQLSISVMRGQNEETFRYNFDG